MKLMITRERELKNWSKANLARRSHNDQALIGKIESGRVKPYPGQLDRIADALGWPDGKTEELLREIEIKEN